jgi:hypothetical protein
MTKLESVTIRYVIEITDHGDYADATMQINDREPIQYGLTEMQIERDVNPVFEMGGLMSFANHGDETFTLKMHRRYWQKRERVYREGSLEATTIHIDDELPPDTKLE